MVNQKDGANVKSPPPVYYLVGVILGILLNRFVYHLPITEGLSYGRIAVGAALLLMGFYMFFAAVSWFRKTEQDPEPWKPTPSIITQGIYRYSRNPIYLGVGLVMTGIGFLLNNFWILLLSIIVLIIIYRIAIIPEEKYLEEKFGEEYLAYKRKVRRWI